MLTQDPAMLRAVDAFPGKNSDSKVQEIKAWLKSKGVRDFEPVTLFSDQLTRVSAFFLLSDHRTQHSKFQNSVQEIEKLADSLVAKRPAIRKVIVKGIPRQAVLKPSHAVYRLQNQRFSLGDRVTMVQDSGGVPLSAKGVVIGLTAKSMDVVWDVPFMSGVTLGDRYGLFTTHGRDLAKIDSITAVLNTAARL